MADEEDFNHSFGSPCFVPKFPTSTIVSVAAVAKCPIMQAYRDTSLVASRILQGFPGFVWFALKLQIVTNQSKNEQVITTC